MFYDGEKLANLTNNVEADGFAINKSTASNSSIPLIGYEKESNRVIYTPGINANRNTNWYIFDFNLNAHISNMDGQLLPYCHDGANHYTNMVNASISGSSNDLVIAHVDGNTTSKAYTFKWAKSSPTTSGFEIPGTSAIWKSKDIDFGSPSIRKKIYKIYVTYKSIGHSGITMKYSTEGSTDTPSDTFDATSSTNYTDKIFQNTDGQWAIAELRPSSSINNIKSIQLHLIPYVGDTLTAAGGLKLGGVAGAETNNTTISLQAEASPGLNYYQNYCIGVYDGDARFNTRVISSSTDANPTVATVSRAFTDKGYTGIPKSGSLYKIGVVSPSFEINDITIIYRAKPIK